jgi:hypothetical protein
MTYSFGEPQKSIFRMGVLVRIWARLIWEPSLVFASNPVLGGLSARLPLILLEVNLPCCLKK